MATLDETMREKIRKFIQTKLNVVRATTDIEFVVVKDIAKTNEDTTEITTIAGTYETFDKKMTYAVVYDFFGKPEPIKGMNLVSYPVRVDFMVFQEDLDEERFNQEKNAIQAFQLSLIGEFFTSAPEDYSFMTSASEYTNTEMIIEMNGVEYVKYTMLVYITNAADGYSGNSVIHKIKLASEGVEEYQEIIVISPKLIGGTDVYETTLLDELTKTQFGLQKGKSHTLQWGFFWYKNKTQIDKLVEVAVAKGTDIFDIIIEYPASITLTNKFYINAFTITTIPGDIIALVFVFKEPENNYL